MTHPLPIAYLTLDTDDEGIYIEWAGAEPFGERDIPYMPVSEHERITADLRRQVDALAAELARVTAEHDMERRRAVGL
jgi:hypothetical protein